MNPLKKGPEIKFKLPKLKRRSGASKPKAPGAVSNLKVPTAVSDVYRDLRDRRLLPLVALLLVAIVAVPILLSESNESEVEPPVSANAGAAGASKSSSRAATIVVSRSAPGLRDYEDRLDHRTPSDPFKPRYEVKSSEAGSASSNSTGSGEEGGSESGGEGSGGTTTGSTTRRIIYFSWVIDARVTPVSSNGVPSETEPTVRHQLPVLSTLPGRKTPALTFVQTSGDGEKALMLVNPNVRGSFGEGVCVSGGETCQMLALKVGQPQTIVYGGNERVFRIEILKIDLIESDKFEKAPLGQKPKQHAG
ncbi:MAG TPA: hypothetical protein VHR18_08405 [Solirubrobacterales bacterium]|jgi:hypothetical protein|nr:hypothetical protein [Solirubrobacterales bacterium]